MFFCLFSICIKKCSSIFPQSPHQNITRVSKSCPLSLSYYYKDKKYQNFHHKYPYPSINQLKYPHHFSSMLKPQPPAKPSIELLAQAPTMDNNRLEKLVKNFVVEDKARLAARNKPMPSSIQYALQKFEKNAQNDATFIKKTTPSRPNSYSSPTSSPTVQVSQ